MVIALLACPLAAALLLLLIRNHKAAGVLVVLASTAVAALSIIVAVTYFDSGWSYDLASYTWLPWVMLGIEIIIAAYIFVVGLLNKRYLISLFAVIGAGLIAWHELTVEHTGGGSITLVMDKLSIIMILIIGVVGSLICVYTVAYMRDYAHHHTDIKDRRVFFMSVLFIFLFAMFGLVISNSLLFLFFFWEVTTLCSYLLIGYTKTKEATTNSLNALVMNLFGGVAFAIAIVLLARVEHVDSLDTLVLLDSTGGLVAVIVFLLALAGLTKAAQMPFSTWLLGAMVAPTPSSALLHSSTMVKAGVYLIIRLSPLLGDTTVGRVVTLVGAFTFLATACLAISQRDAKRILAYSTVSNLGLIVMCGSIGTAEALWAAIMMIIFHAVAKSLLFLAVGSTDHSIGSRDTEDMDGLLRRSPILSFYIIIGIIGMFLAPFGMLISKWAAMKAVIDTDNILLLIILAFGSSVTLFFWTKWLGKVIANRRKLNAETIRLKTLETLPLFTLSILTALTCVMFSIISQSTVLPFLTDMLHIPAGSPINDQDSNILLMMMIMLFILPLGVYEVLRHKKPRKSLVYMAGENTGDDLSFRGSMGQTKQIELRNWYMENIFGEPALLGKSIWISGIGLLLGLFIVAGGFII